MPKTLSRALLTALIAVAAEANEIELSLGAGVTLPFYSQRLAASSQPPPPLPIPGVTLRQDGSFALDASGGSSFGAALAVQLAGPLSLEARVDSAAIELTASQPRFTLQLDVPSLPPLSTSLTPQGTLNVDRLTPLSFNLRLRTGGRFRVTFSAGGSYLPSFSLLATERLALSGVSFAFAAGGTLPGRFGGDAGIGFQIELAPHVAAEAAGQRAAGGEGEGDSGQGEALGGQQRERGQVAAAGRERDAEASAGSQPQVEGERRQAVDGNCSPRRQRSG